MQVENDFINNYVLSTKKIYLKVKAGAKQNSIDGWVMINDRKYLKISIKSAPIKGKANDMIIDFLAEKIGISKSSLSITKGHTSSFKTLSVEC